MEGFATFPSEHRVNKTRRAFIKKDKKLEKYQEMVSKKTIKNKEKRVERAIVRAEKRVAIPHVQGQGSYYSDNIVPFMRRLIPDGTFAKVGGVGGGTLAGMTGIPGSSAVGSTTGKYLGGQLAKLVGFGDYRVANNTIAKMGGSLPEGTQIPTFGNFGHETRVCHREYIADLLVPSVNTAFTNTSYKINAANSGLFPWLAGLAANYQQYRFNGLVFEYRTMSSDITAGGALGSVVFATDYDAIDTAFATKLQMENSQYATSVKPSMSMIHAVECDPQLTQSKLLYTRDSVNSPTATTDARLFDLGNFQVATTGLPGTTGQVLGELWASYDVSLFKPELALIAGGSVENVTATVGVTNLVPFGTTPVLTGANLFSVSVGTMTIFAPGSYVMTLALAGTVFAAPVITGTATVTSVAAAAPLTGQTTTLVTYRVSSVSSNMTVIITLSGSTSITTTIVDLITVANNATFA